MKTIVYYDAECPFCIKKMAFFRKRARGRIEFRPLSHFWKGKKAPSESVIVQDGTTILYQSGAILRILWRIGGVWKIVGIFSYLPNCLLYPFDLIYKGIARWRHRL